MNITNIVVAICSLLLLIIGLDKLSPFMESSCSMMNRVSPTLWKELGTLQIVGGILIWMPRFRKYVAVILIIIKLFFTIFHLANNTYDVGGSLFMAALLGLLIWNPGFMHEKQTAQ